MTVKKETKDWARPVVHWEIEARDPERQRAFYSRLFNWEIHMMAPRVVWLRAATSFPLPFLAGIAAMLVGKP